MSQSNNVEDLNSKAKSEGLQGVDSSELVEKGLESNPESERIIALTKKAEALLQAMKSTEEKGKDLDPNDPDALKLHQEALENESNKAKELGDAVNELAKDRNEKKLDPASPSTGGINIGINTSVFDPLKKLWLVLEKMLKMILEFLSRRVFTPLKNKTNEKSGPGETSTLANNQNEAINKVEDGIDAAKDRVEAIAKNEKAHEHQNQNDQAQLSKSV